MKARIASTSGSLVATGRSPSHPEPAFSLFVRNAFPLVEFGKAIIDFCQKHQPFDCFLERGVLWKIFERLNDPVTNAQLGHVQILPLRHEAIGPAVATAEVKSGSQRSPAQLS
jgi:hypothetical protein